MASSSTRLFQVPCQDLKHSSRVLETAWRQGAVPFRDAWGQKGDKSGFIYSKAGSNGVVRPSTKV